LTCEDRVCWLQAQSDSRQTSVYHHIGIYRKSNPPPRRCYLYSQFASIAFKSVTESGRSQEAPPPSETVSLSLTEFTLEKKLFFDPRVTDLVEWPNSKNTL